MEIVTGDLVTGFLEPFTARQQKGIKCQNICKTKQMNNMRKKHASKVTFLEGLDFEIPKFMGIQRLPWIMNITII